MLLRETSTLVSSRPVEVGVCQELVQVLLGSSDDQRISFLKDGIPAWDGASGFLTFECQDGKATLAVEMHFGQTLSHPPFGNLCLYQGLVPAEVHIVHDGGRGHRPGHLCSHVLLGLYDLVCADLLQDPSVEPAERPGHDERHAELLDVRRSQDARLHVFPDHDRCCVEVRDVQVPEDGLVCGVRRNQGSARELLRKLLDEVLVGVYPEHLVAEGGQGIDHGAPEPAEADYCVVPAHAVPAFPSSLAVREGDIDYAWRVCGLTDDFES